MTIKALTVDTYGEPVIPDSDADWAEWVSASRTRNFVLRDSLVDWLDMYGADKGYSKNEVDPKADFVGVTMERGRVFEQHVLHFLQSVVDVETISDDDYTNRYRLETSEATFDAMNRGVPVIYQGTFRNAAWKTYGSPDFLIRSDTLNELFSDTISLQEQATPAPDIVDSVWHYVVVDSKFATLSFSARSDELLNDKSLKAYKVQVFLYNQMLGKLQGYTPQYAYLLGRGWKREIRKEKFGSRNSMDKLGLVDCDPGSKNGATVQQTATAAIDWIRRLRQDGASWEAEPEPSVPELRANVKGEASYWSDAVKSIAKNTADLTALYYVSPEKRDLANSMGITRWDDPELTTDHVNIHGEKVKPRLEGFLEINQVGSQTDVLPRHIRANREEWHPRPKLEFFVDFETVNTLNDDFSTFPNRGGQELIFMIGCGHIEDGDWQFECFITDRLTETEEAQVIDRWFNHIAAVQERLDPGGHANIFHWSDAEVSFLQNASNSSFSRHPDMNWPDPNWYDLLNHVVREEPVLVRGAHAFGLKAVTKALNNLGLIDIDWPDGTTDGLGAMAGAWWCDTQAQTEGKRLTDYALMDDIRAYNEIDCQAMYEILTYLRLKH